MIALQILPSLGCSLEMLDLLCGIFDNVVSRDDEQFLSPEHRARLRTLEQRLCTMTQRESIITDEESETNNEGRPSHAALVAESYRLAALIYLERVARNASHNVTKVTVLAENAFELLSRLESLERPWPLFVIALEAMDEEKRRLVLDVLDQGSEYRGKVGNMATLRMMVQAAWAQLDLAIGEERLNMLEVYNAVISANCIPPSFT